MTYTLYLPNGQEVAVGTTLPQSIEKASFGVRSATVQTRPDKATRSLVSADSDRIFEESWQQGHLKNALMHYYCYTHNSTVFTCVENIVQSATADAYTVQAEDDQTRSDLLVFLYNIAPNRSFDRLLRTIYRHLLIDGNWYGRIKFVNKNVPVAIHSVDFRCIVPDIPDEGDEIESYSFYPLGGNGTPSRKFKASEILHFTLNDMGDNGTGLSNLESLDIALSLDHYASYYQLGFFKNGVKAGDIYASDGSMSVETYMRDKAYLEANYTAPERAYAPLFLSGKWTVVGRGQEMRKDGDFLNLKKYCREEILSVYSMPLSMISADSSAGGALGGNGKQEDREMLMNNVVAPLQKQVFEDWNRQLIVGRLNNHDVRLLPPGRPKLRLDDVRAAVEMTKAGMTGNEIRAALNMELIEGLDRPLWLSQGTAIVGIPGDADAVFLTSQGPVTGLFTAEFINNEDSDPLAEQDAGKQQQPKPAQNPPDPEPPYPTANGQSLNSGAKTSVRPTASTGARRPQPVTNHPPPPKKIQPKPKMSR